MIRNAILEEKDRVQAELSAFAGGNIDAYRAHICEIIAEAEACYGLHFHPSEPPDFENLASPVESGKPIPS